MPTIEKNTHTLTKEEDLGRTDLDCLNISLAMYIKSCDNLATFLAT